MAKNFDVIIVGAGAAGLTAASDLAVAGLSVVILEARDRIGGRMFTRHDEASGAPIELGAEFIHGKPPEIWDLLKPDKIKVNEVNGDTWCTSHNSLAPCNFFGEVDKILAKMDDASPDESFCSFLERSWPDSKHNSALQEAKRRATSYVSGFNAADPSLVGVHWLVESMRAEERIEGDRVFRAENGYTGLLNILEKKAKHPKSSIELGTVVETIRWKRGSVEILGHAAAGPFELTAPRALITIPLGVLQAQSKETGAIMFEPALSSEKLKALTHLEMGKVIRAVFKFNDRFWERIAPQGRRKTLSNLSFLLSEHSLFPTWWTTSPEKHPIITAWAPFRAAEQLSGKSESFVIDQGLAALGEILKTDRCEIDRQFVSAHFHDWQTDPFSRGAYSYGKVGCDGAQQALADPLVDTLFFAGEATDITGHNGTVHGAIASGHRAAAEILRYALPGHV